MITLIYKTSNNKLTNKLSNSYTKILSVLPAIDTYDLYDELGYFPNTTEELHIKLMGMSR